MANPYNLRIRRTSYPNQSFDSALTAASNEQLVIQSISVKNGSPGVNDIGLGYKFNSQNYSIVLAGVNTSVSCRYRFDLVSFNITTADTSGATYTVQYWNGSSFVPLTLTSSGSFSALGQSNFLFTPPIDWAVDSSGLYTIRFNATTAPNFVYSLYKVINILAFRKGVLPEAVLQARFDNVHHLLLQQGCEIVAFFAIPSPSNNVKVSYQTN